MNMSDDLLILIDRKHAAVHGFLIVHRHPHLYANVTLKCVITSTECQKDTLF